MQRRRAAYFQPRSDYFGRPFDDGILRALIDAEYSVDVYAPAGDLPQDEYAGVRRLPVDYRTRWLARNAFRGSWRAYDLFLGNPDLGTACAAAIAAAARRPFVNAADEIYVGGYEGPALGWWKRAARWGAARARFTIITDRCREELQRTFAGLPTDHRFVPYPCCFSQPHAGRTRADVRSAMGIAADEWIVSMTGALNEWSGAQWVLENLGRIGGRVLIQPGSRPEPVLDALLVRLEESGRAIYVREWQPWRQAVETTLAADVGIVIYLSDKPQFQRMGVSSQKLDTYLWLGLPVVALRQPSFAFIEEFGCGELIDDAADLPIAIERIRADRARYSAAAARAVDEYIRPREKRDALAREFARL